MDQPWLRDISYSDELVASILEQETDLQITNVEFIGEGFDNSAFLVNKDYIFRFVRRREGVDFFRNELIALPELSGKLPLRVPEPAYRGIFAGNWPWAGYLHLTGEPIYKLGINDERRAKFAPDLAKFLKALHGLPIEPLQAKGLPGDWFGHMNLQKRIPFCKAKLEKGLSAKLIGDRMAFHDLLQSVSRLSTENPRVVVHGDFKATHILFHNGRPFAVIDWGDVHIGHPSADLSIAYTFFPPCGRRKFQSEYGEVSEDLWILAHFRAFFHSLAILEYSHETRQIDLFDEVQRALTWMFSDLDDA